MRSTASWIWGGSGALVVAASTIGLAELGAAMPPAGQAAMIGILGILCGLVLLPLVRTKFNLVGPYGIFVLSHTAIFVVRPAYNAAAQEGRNLFTGSVSGGEMIQASIIGAVGFLMVTVGFLLGSRRTNAVPRLVATGSGDHTGRWLRLDRRQEQVLVGLSILVFAGGLALYLVYVRQVGGVRQFLLLNSGRSAELAQALASSSGYVISGLLLTTGTSTLLFAYGLAHSRRREMWTGLVLLVVAVIPQLMTGSRSVFVPVALTLLLLVLQCRPGIVTWPRALAFGIPGFILLFVAPRILRSEVTATNTLSDALRESFSTQGVLDGFLGSYDTAMIDSFALQVQAQATGQLPLTGGTTYLSALASFVPRALWPNKPLAVDTVLNHALFPETAAKGIGFSFGVYSEPLLNWGIVGVVLVGVLFGLVLGCSERALNSTSSLLTLVAVAMLAGQVFTLVRGSLSFDTQRLLIPLLPLLLVWLIAQSARLPRQRRAPAVEELRGPTT